MAKRDERPLLAGLVAGAPLHQAEQDRVEVEPLLRQPVLEALRARLVLAPLEDPVRDESVEAVGEDVPGEPGVALELAEATHPEEALAKDQQRLAIADDRGGRL